jgi:hypothetical protein
MTQSPAYPKRLIEIDLPIGRISAHARREKSIRHGHISTLHIWWAPAAVGGVSGGYLRGALARSG